MARIFFSKGCIHGSRKEVVYLLRAAFGQMLSHMLVLACLLNEIGGRSSAGDSHKVGKLTLQKKAGMDGDNVEEFGLSLGVTELLQCCDRFSREFHSDITSPIRSSPRSADLPR